ncbi:helix-turn-helix domain-containing protein [Micromonospora sp. NPDC047762]|uniref:helix-turn-helix domain-containing protein n=1 Tax=Micromonospora sp. NPDC047762 TaxID=3364255 RepID=UPI00371C8181
MPVDQLQTPDGFWARQDVRTAVRVRDIGTLVRLLVRHTGASQTRIGAVVGLEQGYVSRVIAGRKVTSIDVLERIADGCGMPDETRMSLGLAVLTAEALVMEAHAHAAARDERACTTALHQAEQTLDRADRSSDPQWLGYFDEAYLSAKFGHCFHALGRYQQAERFTACSLQMDERYVRGKAFNLTLLASIHAHNGEPDRASVIGAKALTLTSQLRSARAVRYLRDLQTKLTAHRRRPAVRHFINRVDVTLGQRR